MFRAFKVSDLEISRLASSDSLQTLGRALQEIDRNNVARKLERFIAEDGVIDGRSLADDWFPDISPDIFISHSHADKELALGLAGWLQSTFGLHAFVDGAIWGNADDLLRVVDNRYCLNPNGETYSYDLRNQSTSHVHMMLNVALMKTIDSSECVWFLNTPNAISSKEAVEKTASPWIFAELALANHLRRQSRRTSLAKSAGITDGRSVPISHEADFSGFEELSFPNLFRWATRWKSQEGSAHALDVLYEVIDGQR